MNKLMKQLHIVKMSFLSELIYELSVIPIKIWTSFFMELDKLILNSSEDTQSPSAKFWKRRTKREELLHAILKYVRKKDNFAYEIKFLYQKTYQQISKLSN